MLTLNQRRRAEFQARKDALIRSLDLNVPQETAAFIRQYRALILEYAEVLPSAYVAWAKAIKTLTLKIHSSNTQEVVG